jgi:malonyl-CoA/methylmalonyl-CoA synthetase
VIGAPHPDFGEGVIAVVTLHAGTKTAPDSLIERLRPHIAAYKLPKQVICVDTLPRNSMGKVQKNLLREKYRAIFSDSKSST